jgi:hypothetical protein
MKFHKGRAFDNGLFLILLLPFLFCSLLSPASASTFTDYTPKPRHLPLLKSALERESSNEEPSDLWVPLADQGWKPCIEPENTPSIPEYSKGYLQVFLDGGLNQQRMGICDAVAVAKILNATLVIPHLEINPVCEIQVHLWIYLMWITLLTY